MFQNKLLGWYDIHGRNLPWRSKQDPYYILLSELMLQQTQVVRVIEKISEFMGQYPDFSSIAKAPVGDLIRAWTGMGYNNRVLRFQKLAQIVMREYGGKLPSDIEVLQKLPGIGRYTAHAVACFAFGQHVPIVDVNIRRIYSRFHWRMQYFHEMKDEALIWDIARSMLPNRSYDYNQALMDLGATICTARRPLCSDCPVRLECKSASRLVQGKETKRLEPNLRGVPNRLYRGKIVEYLRTHRQSRLMGLGEAVVPDFSTKDSRWLEEIILGLERDGLVLVVGKSVRLP